MRSPPTSSAIPLRRRGAWLIAEQKSWQMHSVLGPLDSIDPSRQLFRVETASEDILLVSRPTGERGMRELRLESLLHEGGNRL